MLALTCSYRPRRRVPLTSATPPCPEALETDESTFLRPPDRTNPDKDYSHRPLSGKLGIREGSAVLIAGSPPGFRRMLEPLPEGVRLTRNRAARSDVIVFFAGSETDLRKIPSLASRLDPAGGLWVAYPKKTSALASDLDFGKVQAAGLAAGLVDNKSCAIDNDWTAMRFVYRVADRAGISRNQKSRPGP